VERVEGSSFVATAYTLHENNYLLPGSVLGKKKRTREVLYFPRCGANFSFRPNSDEQLQISDKSDHAPNFNFVFIF